MSSSPATDRQTLTRERIVAAALELMQAEGLAGLSTRKLAAMLGISSPSIYWHFATMAELRDHMADALLADAVPDPETAGDGEGDWRRWLAKGAHGIRQAALSHRDGAQLLAAARPNVARRALRIRANLARLEREGFSPEAAAAVFIALSRYALGAALGEQDSPGSPRAAASPRAEAVFSFGLEAMLDGFAAMAARDRTD